LINDAHLSAAQQSNLRLWYKQIKIRRGK